MSCSVHTGRSELPRVRTVAAAHYVTMTTNQSRNNCCDTQGVGGEGRQATTVINVRRRWCQSNGSSSVLCAFNAECRPRRRRHRPGRSTSGRYPALPAGRAGRAGLGLQLVRSLLGVRGGRGVRWGRLVRAGHRVRGLRSLRGVRLVLALLGIRRLRGCSASSGLVVRRLLVVRPILAVRWVQRVQRVQRVRGVLQFRVGQVVQRVLGCLVVRRVQVGLVGRAGMGCRAGSRPPRRLSGVGRACLGLLGHRELLACR